MGQKPKIQFAEFRTLHCPFTVFSRFWELSKNLFTFWMQLYASGLVPELSEIAVRVFSTPANSDPSEPSFSIQNLVHDQKRNQLDPGRVNGLIFVHVYR